jgi:hypothetical protein
MSEDTTIEAEVIRLRQSIETQMRRWILEATELVLEEELTEALGTGRYERRWCTNRNAAASPHSRDLHQAPIAKDSGLPRATIRFRMLQPIIASVSCDFG